MTFLALAIGLCVVVGGILVVRLHAFLALVAAGLIVALMTPPDVVFASAVRTAPTSSVSGSVSLDTFDGWTEDNRTVAPSVYDDAATLANQSAINRLVAGFGQTARKIGILIAMAAVIGICMLESGAAERIVMAIQSSLGERQTAMALVLSSFILAIPVYFDTVFFLMLPLAQSLAQKRGRDYLKFVLAIVVGGSLAHSLVPPTPGPLLVASELGVPILAMMIGGVAVGLPGVAAGAVFVRYVNLKMNLPVPASIAKADRLDSVALPPLLVAFLPVVLPVVCLAAGTLLKQLGTTGFHWVDVLFAFVGDKNIALSLAAAVALVTLVRRSDVSAEEGRKTVERALADGGTVILITCAGGAFGTVIQQTDIAHQLGTHVPAVTGGVSLLFLAFFLTALIRVAQGSATVAMVTAVGIVGPIAAGTTLPYHPVYLALAVGCGSKPLPWMNDSGFWVISKMAGLTESQTLRTFTVLLTIMGVVAFAATVAGALLLPLV